MSTTNITVPHGWRPTYDTCHEVSPICPVKATTLGYYPSLGFNIFFAVGYALAAVVTLSIGVWKRTWGFSIAVTAGCILECVGKQAPHSSSRKRVRQQPPSPSHANERQATSAARASQPTRGTTARSKPRSSPSSSARR